MTLVTVENKATNSARSVNPTLRDIIYRALRRINVYTIRQTPADNEVSECVAEFNAMMQGWFLSNIVVSFTEQGLDDTPSLPIGTTDPLYYDDCLIDNLCMRLIEIYNLDARSFGQIAGRARLSLDKVNNLKRDVEFAGETFKSDFDATLRNTPDLNRVYTNTAS